MSNGWGDSETLGSHGKRGERLSVSGWKRKCSSRAGSESPSFLRTIRMSFGIEILPLLLLEEGLYSLTSLPVFYL